MYRSAREQGSPKTVLSSSSVRSEPLPVPPSYRSSFPSHKSLSFLTSPSYPSASFRSLPSRSLLRSVQARPSLSRDVRAERLVRGSARQLGAELGSRPIHSDSPRRVSMLCGLVPRLQAAVRHDTPILRLILAERPAVVVRGVEVKLLSRSDRCASAF
jgi:hypothetical protein